MYYNDYNKPEDQDPRQVVEEPFRTEPTAPRRPRKKSRGGGTLLTLGLCCALVGGLAGGGAVYLAGQHAKSSTTIYESSHAPVAVSVADIHTGKPLTMPEIYAKNVPATVGITTELVTTNFFGQSVKGAAAGSGFVVSQDGYILTNYHVINGATSIQVAFADGTTYPAVLVGGEPGNDIAVLKIDAQNLPTVALGDSDNLVVGEQVCAIGNPLGELTYTFTVGYVSARDRTITMENNERMNMLQTDTAINPGNSGGPLFNSYGEVIGINTAKYSSNGSSGSVEGIGFAIPINDVKSMVTDFIEHGYLTGRPSVGILMDDVSQDATLRYGIPAGVYLNAVLPGSCAEKAGLKAGDIITAVGDTPVTNGDQFKAVIKDTRAGDEITLTVYRDGRNETLSLTLDEATKERGEAMDKMQQKYQEELQKKHEEEQQEQQLLPFDPFNPFGW